ncbi:DNA cytosine methyltransferase [Microcystis aeruginosa LEGE 00239]|uniref:DNA cytosine methyltransferase n=1 Tax=Microcystis aeruginosa TaxID=1126 RepID=UPI00187E51BD|nr:DNA cytosine methyltransferase [Microcystis aeruginosa]MBE9244941.1 DNA cytosine methyltransferase [Microcystis aeruginosa LEGE 00239]
MTDHISTVDLFCGAGGLTHGFEKARLIVKAGYDIDPACQFPYEHNNNAQFILKNIEDVSGDDLASHFYGSKVKILAGCAPCQPFSTYSRRYQHRDMKWKLLQDFARLVQDCQPDIVSMENVPQLQNTSVFEEFIQKLISLNYTIESSRVNCLDYGIPQTRKRLVLLASRFGRINLLPATHSPEMYATVRKTIADLQPLQAGQKSDFDPLHQCSNLSALNLRRIRVSKPGGTWSDWPEELIASCHLKNSGKTYPSVYGRMEWDQPSPTITTQFFGYGNGRFGHPEQDRAISLREAALLQTFPQNYQFLSPNEPVVFDRIGRLIGNAVPVKLAEVIALSILNHIQIFIDH